MHIDKKKNKNLFNKNLIFIQSSSTSFVFGRRNLDPGCHHLFFFFFSGKVIASCSQELELDCYVSKHFQHVFGFLFLVFVGCKY